MNKCNVGPDETYFHFQGLERSVPGSCCEDSRELGLNVGCAVRRLSADAHKIAVWRLHPSSCLRIMDYTRMDIALIILTTIAVAIFLGYLAFGPDPSSVQ